MVYVHKGQFDYVEQVDREREPLKKGTNGYVCPSCNHLCPCKFVGISIFVCLSIWRNKIMD